MYCLCFPSLVYLNLYSVVFCFLLLSGYLQWFERCLSIQHILANIVVIVLIIQLAVRLNQKPIYQFTLWMWQYSTWHLINLEKKLHPHSSNIKTEAMELYARPQVNACACFCHEATLAILLCKEWHPVHVNTVDFIQHLYGRTTNLMLIRGESQL